MNTGQRDRLGRVIYQGPRGGRYVLTASGRHAPPAAAVGPAAASHTAPAGSPPVPSGFKKVTVNGQRWIVSVQGQIRRPNGTRVALQPRQVNKILTHVARNHPAHLSAEHIPYVSSYTNITLPNNPSYVATNQYLNSRNRPGYAVRIYFKRNNGTFYYRTANGRFVSSQQPVVPHHIRMNIRHITQYRQFFSMFHNNYPNNASSPVASGPRTNAQLIDNMNHQLRQRGAINVTKYTANEKERLAKQLLERVQVSKAFYKERKAAGNSESTYGSYANNAKRYFRGYRAVKPLTGNVKSPRVRSETPNRGSPAAKNARNFVSFNNLKTPHIVVKRKGTETFHVNPNTLIGFIKSGSGANIKNANLRNWLRQMRRNHPSEPLFQHPASKDKTVRPKNIRFTR